MRYIACVIISIYYFEGVGELLKKEQVEKILNDLEELNTILDNNIEKNKDEIINKIDGMIELLELVLKEYEKK